MKLYEITDPAELEVERDTGREIHLKDPKRPGFKTIIPKDPNKPGMVTQDENGEYVVNPDATGRVDNKLKVGAKVKMASKIPTHPGSAAKPKKPNLPGGTAPTTDGAIL